MIQKSIKLRDLGHVQYPHFESITESLEEFDEETIVSLINQQIRTELMNQARHFQRYGKFLEGHPVWPKGSPG